MFGPYDNFNLEDDDSYGNGSCLDVLKLKFYEMVDSVDRSTETASFTEEIRQFFDGVIARARGKPHCSGVGSTARRVSMLPCSSKCRKTHGMKHMRAPYG